MIVMKFGGTSVGSPSAIERACSIIQSRTDRHLLVVVSAIGDTTDRLAEAAEAGPVAGADLLRALRDRTEAVTQALVSGRATSEMVQFLDEVIAEARNLLHEIDSRSGRASPSAELDALLGIGERISSRLVALALLHCGLAASNLDSRELFVSEARHGGASPLLSPTRERLQQVVPQLLSDGLIPVIGGFIATGEDGSPTTLGRGGSDCTATIAGAALGAEEVQIWTDVDGVMTADPSLIGSARSLPLLSIREASELAYFGGRVLHPSTMLPAIESGIPIRVLNSRHPEAEGTLIVAEPSESETVVKSVVYKENITLIDIYSTRMLMAHGFLAQVFAIFEKHETPVDMVSTSEVSVSMTVDRTESLPDILEDLSKISDAEATSGKAIVCVVGEGIRYTPGIAAKVFNSLEGIRIRMISLGASRVNVGFVIDEKDLEVAVRRLHTTFFDEASPLKGELQ